MIPKAELHCHLEGSIPPALARELATRNGLELPAGLMGADGFYVWQDFLSFLSAYDRVCMTLRQPLLLQSMYLFKQPHIGGEVGWHQDATYLHTRPSTVTGFWIALDDAGRDNGCLMALPGGHRGPLRQRFHRAGAAPSHITTSWASAWAVMRPNTRPPISRQPIAWPTTGAMAAPSMPAR